MACFSSGAYYLLLLLLIPSVHNKDTLQNFDRADITHLASDFTRHTLVKPRIYHGREKRQISSTKEEDGVHSSHLLVEIEVDDKDLVLDLSLNKGLLSKGFFHRYQENGLDKVYTPEAQDVELCQYSGKVRGEPNSWVALSTCEGLSGVIYDGREMHYIEKNSRLAKPDLEDSHFLYKHSDLAESNKTCGYEGTEGHDHDHRHDKSNRILRYKRHIENSELVRGPYNANKESKYVELVLVIDNREYKELGENRHNVELHCKTIANIINGLYSPLNIFIALVGVVIWTEHDEISFSSNGDTTLTNFLHYRREKLIKDHPNDNAQLLSKFNFDNGVVGKALKGPICTYEYSGGVNTDHSPVIGLVATTVAHEMGHNFGMEHDTNECKCPDARCIMAPSSSSEAPTHWSSCSLNYLLLAFTHGMDYCLKNKPIALFDSPVCGNGFVEPGEQCDCGLAEHCDNTCCNATTCMLYSNASCATGECCDLTTCRPKTAGSLCRSADYECDLPEYCTGQSEYCPPDIFKMDTESCDNGKAYCYHGFCRTRTDQCKLLWGETGKSSDEQCYKMNTKGTRHGNCGYNKFNQSFSKCSNESILCGMLHCRHLNERLEFGMESVAILSQSFINSKGTIIPCRTAIVDLGINQVDPGLAPDGASCGVGKMCVNQRCMNVESLRRDSGLTCPHNCNGNGWCNSLGHCHCQEQFAPPYCEFAGHGGSEDSGPATDPNKNQAFVQALFIIFLGIIPAAALAAWCLMQAKRTSMCQTRAKSLPIMVKSPGKPRPSGTNGGAFLEVTKRTDDNHSLLRGDSPPPIGFRSEFFGKCNGFTISPASKVPPEPVRAAPPVPVVAPTPQAAKVAKPAPNVPTIAKKQECEPMRNAPPPPTVPQIAKGDKAPSTARSIFLKGPLRVPSFKQRSLSNALSHINQASAAPALPPPNPGSNARPIISAPVLEASTCTAKELLSPLRNAPKVPIRPVMVITEKEKIEEEEKKEVIEKEKIEVKKVSKENSALTRITSFLKPSDKKLQQTSSNQVKANKIDKTQLRTMEISNPILQTHIEVPTNALPVDTEANKAVVMRAQSMRGPTVTKRPAIPTFGSMRQSSGSKRPVSIPCGTRPKSPPPPRPPVSDVTHKSDEYDDCLNKKAPLAGSCDETSPTSGDNIYAVIEDSPVSPESVKSAKNDTESGDSMGLLCEIVSEIQNRNFDSIYSTSTLARKKKEEEEKRRLAKEQMYENTITSPIYKSPESNSPVYKSPESSEYSNMSNVKSSASSTSSGGYIHPSAVNKPIVHSEKSKKSPTDTSSVSKTTTFKTANSPFVRPQGPTPTHKQSDGDKKIKTPPSPKRPQINRQVTPPNLRTRKPSPTRPSPPPTTSSRNRSITNSPDLVTSCNSKSVVKQPDVLNGGPTVKKPAPSVKPNVNGLPKGPPAKIINKAVSFKTVQEKSGAAGRIAKTNSDAGKSVPAGLKNVSKQNSNVASLQQKFENKSVKSTA